MNNTFTKEEKLQAYKAIWKIALLDNPYVQRDIQSKKRLARKMFIEMFKIASAALLTGKLCRKEILSAMLEAAERNAPIVEKLSRKGKLEHPKRDYVKGIMIHRIMQQLPAHLAKDEKFEEMLEKNLEPEIDRLMHRIIVEERRGVSTDEAVEMVLSTVEVEATAVPISDLKEKVPDGLSDINKEQLN